MKVRELTEEYIKLIEKDLDESKKSYDEAFKYIESSTAIYHGEHIRFAYIPKLYTNEVIDYFKYIAKTTHGILSKIIDRYMEDREYRKLFPFSKELEELILCDSGYDQPLPIARIDLFFNEDDFSFKFCEFNADGASAMNEDRELNNAYVYDDIFKKFSENYNIGSFELFDSWVEEFMNIYNSFENKVENPTIAIVDFMESATKEEFKVFKSYFEKKGYKTVIADITTLKYNNGLYTEDGIKIDAVYRRAVTSELMKKIDKASAFVKAIKDKTTCIIGSIRTQVIHNKIIYKIMRQKETFDFLTEEERAFVNEHIPYTSWLNTGEFNREEVISNKDKWIIKPDDLYGAKGVYAGVDYTKEEFAELVDENTDKGYLLQEYATMYKTKNFLKEKNGDFVFDEFSNMPGLFLYNGKFKGVYCRAGRQGIICEDAGGIAICSKYVDV